MVLEPILAPIQKIENILNNIYPLDIWQIIFEHCDALLQLRLFAVCHCFYQFFFINSVPDVHDITYSVLKQKKFNKVTILDLSWNTDICDISFLTNLKRLCANNTIDQEAIQKLDLIELDLRYNKKIKNISFMSNLKKLFLSNRCKIDQNGIHKLDLIELYANGNQKVNNVSFMINLKILSVGVLAELASKEFRD
jgi:hypothetical protein